jgi:hypothetical protein
MAAPREARTYGDRGDGVRCGLIAQPAKRIYGTGVHPKALGTDSGVATETAESCEQLSDGFIGSRR